MQYSIYRHITKLSGATPQEKMVLTVIAGYWNPEQGCAWPSTQRIAEEVGLSLRSIHYYLRKLVSYGILIIDSGKSNRKNNRYRFNLQVKSVPSVQEAAHELPNQVTDKESNKEYFAGQGPSQSPDPVPQAEEVNSFDKTPQISYKSKGINWPSWLSMEKSKKNLAQALAGLSAAPGHKQSPGAKLQSAWRDAVISWQMAAGNEKYYFPSLTGKDAGQLAQIGKKVGTDTAITLVEYLVGNWSDFGWYVKDSVGLKNYPTNPHIGFVLTHLSLATVFHGQHLTKQAHKVGDSEALAKALKKPVAINVTTKTQPSGGDSISSMEELNALLESLEKGHG